MEPVFPLWISTFWNLTLLGAVICVPLLVILVGLAYQKRMQRDQERSFEKILALLETILETLESRDEQNHPG